MAIAVNSVATLNQHAAGVISRSNHHAQNVQCAYLMILGCVTWRADPTSISLRESNGNMANMGWFEVGGHRYSVRYNHATRHIEVLDRSQRGPVLFSCDDDTPSSDIRDFFATL